MQLNDVQTDATTAQQVSSMKVDDNESKGSNIKEKNTKEEENIAKDGVET